MERASHEIVEAFATALDHDDYESAQSYLHADCRYEVGAEKLIGRSAVIDSFRDNSKWAHSHLDKIVFFHTIERCDEHECVIKFIDLLEHAGKQGRHECLMHVAINGDGLIEKLLLEDLPGEKQKVNEFLSSVGISR